MSYDENTGCWFRTGMGLTPPRIGSHPVRDRLSGVQPPPVSAAVGL